AQRTSSMPPGSATRTRSPTWPRRRSTATAAHAPLPQASVSPTPRSNTRRRMLSGASTCAKPTLQRSGKRAWRSMAGPTACTGAGADVGHLEYRVRIAERDRADLVARAVRLDRVAIGARFRRERDARGLEFGHAHVEPHGAVVEQLRRDHRPGRLQPHRAAR